MATTTHTSTLYATELRLRPVTLAMHIVSAIAVVASLVATHCSPIAFAATIPILSNQLYLHTHNGRTTVGMAPLAIMATGLAALAALLAVRLPTPARILCILAATMAAATTIVLAFWFVRIRSCYRRHPALDPDAAIIVLGGAIRNGRPCRTLARRLDVAVRYGHAQPGIMIVPTGGPTPDHTTTEAEAMARYLREQGIDPERILPETEALNTQQNIANACALLDARGIHTQRCVVSSDYHLWRALRDARTLGFELTPIPAPTPAAGRAQQWCREVLTILAVGRRGREKSSPSSHRDRCVTRMIRPRFHEPAQHPQAASADYAHIPSTAKGGRMTEKLLLINDLAGYGKVALGAMMPVLTHMGYDLYTLPTALVSNTLDYGAFEILDTTDYIERTLATWQELGFSFDAVSTGFIASERQARLITEFCRQQQAQNVPVFVDPIMGDNGRLYNSIERGRINALRDLVATADVAVPNYTEACLLTGAPYAGTQGMDEREVDRLLDCMRRICPRSVVITSAFVYGKPAVIGYDHERDESFTIPFEEVPVHFPGTGDVFTSVLMGRKLAGRTLEDATAIAMHVVKDMIKLNRDADDTYKGIPIERYLSQIKR